MEGRIATWYAKATRKDFSEFERLAQELAKQLPPNARVLEIAPGPGYLSVALAKLGPFCRCPREFPDRGALFGGLKITGLDISQTFVQMASEYAKREGVVAHFIHGSASDIPLEDGLFDLIVCRAAFKNFSEPLKALNEMHRVQKPGGKAVILDLRKDTSWQEIENYVKQSGRSPLDAWMTKLAFKHMLLKRAYTEEQMKSLVFASDFKSCQVLRTPIGMEVTLVRQRSLAEQAA
jgi:ubiquinone/menaquinone biosynthesis C-methylase UbiE